eukprot:m.239983 g.239983  ORF g.239983 m.239983 type:complete len:1268 (-) comp26267_c4_seq4:1403-5206(-)
MDDPDVSTFRERANTAHRSRVQSNAAERAVERVDAQPRRGRFFRSKRDRKEKGSRSTTKQPPPAASSTYTPPTYKANELNLSNDMLLAAMSRVKTGESMDDVIAGLLEVGVDSNKPTRAATSAVGLRPPPDRRQATPRNQSSAGNESFDKRKAAIRSRAATVQQRKSRAMTAASLQHAAPKSRTATGTAALRPPKPARPVRPPLEKTAIVEEEAEEAEEAVKAAPTKQPEETVTDEPVAAVPAPVPPKPNTPTKPTLAPKPTAAALKPKLAPKPAAASPVPPTLMVAKVVEETSAAEVSPASNPAPRPPVTETVATRPSVETPVAPSPPSIPSVVETVVAMPPPASACAAAVSPVRIRVESVVVPAQPSQPAASTPVSVPTPPSPSVPSLSIAVAVKATPPVPVAAADPATPGASSPPPPPAAVTAPVKATPAQPTKTPSAEPDANAPILKHEPPPKAKKLQGNKFAALAALLETRVTEASKPVAPTGPSSFPPLPPIPGSLPPPPGPPLPPASTNVVNEAAPGKSAAELEDLSGDRNAAAYIEEKRRREQRAKAVRMLGVRALAERNRAASMARRDFENEMAAMAGRLRKKNDDRFTKKAEAVEEEEDEEMSPALAAALAKVRAEKKAKDEAALQKMREAQVLAGDRSAAAFLEAKAEKAKAAEAKNKLSVKEQAALDQQAEEKRAAFEAEMKARSSNLKEQTTKVSAISVKDMFAGEDMSAVTKFAGGGDVEEADEDDGKSDFLKEIERKKRLKKKDTETHADTALFSGVNETNGDPRGQHALTVVRATGKAITVRWPSWEGDKVSYAILKDGEMMTATEPGESSAATILPLDPKTTYRIKVIALGPNGVIGDEFAERNCSTAGAGQTWANAEATSEAPKLAPTPAAPAAPTPAVKISVLRSSPTSVTLVWQPFGGTTIAESKRKCFCIMMDEEVQAVTEQNDKTVAVVPDIKAGSHLFRIVALNFDGTPAAESKALTLTFDGTTPPVENRALSEGSDAPLAPQAEAVDATQAPAEIVLVVSEVEPEFTWEGAPWAIEFAKMQKVGLPEEMIRMKMTPKGVSSQDADDFFSAGASPNKENTESSEERVIMQKLDRRRQTLSRKESCAAWEAKKQRRLSTAIQRRNIREKIFESEPTNPAVASASEELTAAETSFREALSEELEGLAIESDSLQGPDLAAFENRHISVIFEKMEELPKMMAPVVDEEEYIEDLNDLVDVADQLQLDESVFDSLAAEMDYFDDNDISELAQEFDTIPEEEKKALFGE